MSGTDQDVPDALMPQDVPDALMPDQDVPDA
jgi:hypothetical protein